MTSEQAILNREQLDSIYQLLVDSYALAGLAVGIVKDGQMIYGRGFGVRDISGNEPVTTSTLFHMASISKPFVATAIMQLVEEGKVDLDGSIVSYLPYFKLADPRYKELTIKQFLTHTSGMPDVEDYLWHKPEYDDEALERFVRGVSGETLLYDPGTAHEYSNMAFEVLGDLIAKVSGKSFEEYMAEHILSPLAMRNSTFLKTEVKSELATTPHLCEPQAVVSEIYPYNRRHAPSSTLHSSVDDMCNWAIANLNRGTLNGQSILPSSSYDALWHPYCEGEEENERVGLSWFLQEHQGQHAIFHGGEDVGYETSLALYPDLSAAIVVMANAVPAPVGIAAEFALNALLGKELQVPKPPVVMQLAPTIVDEDTAVALQAYQALKTSMPDAYGFDADQFYNLGNGFGENGKVDQAIQVLAFVAAVFPQDAQAHAFLAWAHKKNEDRELCAANAKVALSINPEKEWAKELLAWAKETAP